MLVRRGPSPEKRGEVIKHSTLCVIDYHLNLQWLTITHRELGKKTNLMLACIQCSHMVGIVCTGMNKA